MVRHFITPEEKEQYLTTIRTATIKEVDITAAKLSN